MSTCPRGCDPASAAPASSSATATPGSRTPSYDDTRYVVELAAPHVVNTMPETTLDAVADHGQIRGDTIRRNYPQAQAILDRLATVGVSYDDVVAALETDGVTKFQASWDELLDSVTAAMHANRPEQEARP